MQQISTKAYKTRYDWVGKVIHWELCKKGEVWPFEKWYVHNPEPIIENEKMGFWDTNGSPNLGQTTRPSDSEKKRKKVTCRRMDFDVLADHWVKLKEIKKKEKLRNLARELKKLSKWKKLWMWL